MDLHTEQRPAPTFEDITEMIVAARRMLIWSLNELAAVPTAGAVAYRLAAEGYTGIPGKSGQCPVACWVRGHTGLSDVAIGPVSATVYVNDIWVTEFEMPAAVQRFVAEFDARQHPSLEYRAPSDLDRQPVTV